MIYKHLFPKIGKNYFSGINLPPNLNQRKFIYRPLESGMLSQHQFHHMPLSYYIEVLSCTLNPSLISNETLNLDARMRAKQILDQIVSVGSYSESKGIGFVRDDVCKFITKMDGVAEPSREEIFLTEGAESGINLLFRGLIADERDVVLLPAPYYPLYPQAIKMNGGSVAHYKLDRHQGWEIDIDELKKLIRGLELVGKRSKAIVIINPGNPTGHTLSPENIAKILEFSVNHRLLVIADQVFRQNISKEKTIFRSCRSMLDTLPSFARQNCELVSIHSISKGLTMMPGLRGGYLYLHNLSPFVMQQMSKFQTTHSCSNILGQLMIDLMVNPFQGMSQATRHNFEAEYQNLRLLFSKRGRLMAEALTGMQSLRCKYPEQAMYLYPEVQFSSRAIAAAEAQGKPIDRFYCQRMQQNTGTALVPGSTFGQPQDSHHFRISPCVVSDKQLPIFMGKFKKANSEFHQKYIH